LVGGSAQSKIKLIASEPCDDFPGEKVVHLTASAPGNQNPSYDNIVSYIGNIRNYTHNSKQWI